MKIIVKFIRKNYDVSAFLKYILMIIVFGLVMLIFAFLIFNLPSGKGANEAVKAVVTGVFTICAAVLTGFFAHENTNREIAMQYIMGKRLDWLNRASITTAKLCSSMCEYFCLYNSIIGSLSKKDYEKLTRIYSKIMDMLTDLYLHYNFTGGRDKKILKLIRFIEGKLRKFHDVLQINHSIVIDWSSVNDLEIALDALVKHSQIYSKLEWERIKAEANYTGNIKLRDNMIRKNMIKNRLRLYKKQVEFDAESYDLSDLSIAATRNELEKDLR